MKAQELREKSIDELNGLLEENLREQFALRIRRGAGKLEQTHLKGEVRKTVARIKTIITEKQGD
ncbi:MAG: 50S ribosomal protein L29 [Gammaproteobacteria bacterium]|nr:MAG: 50S ribosomal protein L29 [Gammaproteobacteria bacterium]